MAVQNFPVVTRDTVRRTSSCGYESAKKSASSSGVYTCEKGRRQQGTGQMDRYAGYLQEATHLCEIVCASTFALKLKKENYMYMQKIF